MFGDTIADNKRGRQLVLMAKGLIGGLFQIAFFAVFLLVPARIWGGTWYWPRAIWFLAGYGILVEVSIIWLARVAPASLEVRFKAPLTKKQPVADRVVSSILFTMIFAWVALIPIDVFHFQLFPKPSLLASVLGGVMLLIGFGIILATLFQNSFAAPIVEDQTEEGQVVIDTGLYGLVRHPMYLGFIPYFIGLALWLESYVSALSVLLIVGTLIARVFIEEKTLQENLPGYPEYMEKTRYRLIPFIW